MDTYTVKFWFHTDLRCEAVVKARSYHAALALGLEEVGEADWARAPGFRIEIRVGDGR